MKAITEYETAKLKFLNSQSKKVSLRKTELAIYLPLYLEIQKSFDASFQRSINYFTFLLPGVEIPGDPPHKYCPYGKGLARLRSV